MTKADLDYIIKQVTDAGFHVIAVCCDMGGANMGLAKEYGISIDKTTFEHPHPDWKDEKIWWLYDAVHCMKNCRNHLKDEKEGAGLTVPDEEGGKIKIGMKELDKLFTALEEGQPVKKPKIDEPSDFSKLNRRKLLMIKNQDLQRVLPATQLMSRTTHNAIHAYFRKNKTNKSMMALARFVLLMDSWFDTMNSSVTKSKKNKLKCAFGEHLAIQKKALEQAMAFIREVRVGTHKSMIKWQQGLIIGTTSLLGIFEKLKTQYGRQSVCTT